MIQELFYHHQNIPSVWRRCISLVIYLRVLLATTVRSNVLVHVVSVDFNAVMGDLLVLEVCLQLPREVGQVHRVQLEVITYMHIKLQLVPCVVKLISF